MVILGSNCSADIGSTSFIQLTEGAGLPLASHGRMASVLTGKVWLAGPTLMMGGGSFVRLVTSR